MIRSLHVDNFRSHSDFRLEKLGRVNLLVGTNNSGKTSLLEAIELLMSQGDGRTIQRALNRRGEQIWEGEEEGHPEVDVCRLFHGYSMELGDTFSLTTHGDGGVQSLIAEVAESEPSQSELFVKEGDPFSAGNELILHWKKGVALAVPKRIPLTVRGGLSYRLEREARLSRRRYSQKENRRAPLSFITTASLDIEGVTSLLNQVLLNPEEELLLHALRIIDPAIERFGVISPTRSAQYAGTSGWGGNIDFNVVRGGVVIKCQGIDKRLPIGTMGDGIWRLLALALSLVNSSGGVLLVDEIDTGLHYSVMEKMWKLVHETARKLDVQVFATTHSSDCWKALAAISRDDVGEDSEVTIQRIEAREGVAVHFSEPEIIIAAEENLEVR